MKKTLGRCLPHHAPSELQRIIDNGFEARPISVTPPGPHGPWTSPSVRAIHEPKRPATHMRTCPPIIYFSVISAAKSFKQPLRGGFSRQVHTCDVQEFAAEMGDAKRPAASNHRPAKRPPKTPTAQCLFLERSIQHTKHLQAHFWSELLPGCALTSQISSQYVARLQTVLTTMTFSSLAQLGLSERHLALRNINSPNIESACQRRFNLLFNSLKNIWMHLNLHNLTSNLPLRNPLLKN